MILLPSAPGCLSLSLHCAAWWSVWLHSEIVLGISDGFLSVLFFSQTCSLAASAGPVLEDSPSKSSQLCTGGAASKERA